MPTSVIIRDESTGLGREDHVFTLQVPSESITVRELIRERVYQEVDDYNRVLRDRSQAPKYHGLVQPDASEVELNTASKPKQVRQLNWKKQFDIAIDAYERNQFILLVGDQQTTSLDQTIKLTPSTEVVFLRLVMLVGG